MVNAGLNLSLCITQGRVTINGWNRKELRVFVQDGSKFGFKVLQTDPRTQEPVWMSITSLEARNKGGSPTECIVGGEIEIDIPVNATVMLKGQATTTIVDTVRKVTANTAGGNISFRNVAEGITARTYEGVVTVEGSKGAMDLETTTGNIVVVDAGPSEIGDIFKARTSSGSISIQGIEHRQVDANSISGSVLFNGEILSGGTYSFSTQNGSIKMSLPQNSACTISATYGYGTFNSELPFKQQTENITEGDVKNIVGILGTGGNASLRLTTANGSIGIKKQ
jgi:DUF4097 and DUF4098 domain-containing protein YvlB